MKKRPILILGGAGFIGTNLALRLAGLGRPVTIFDNLSGPSSRDNLLALGLFADLVTLVAADIRDREKLKEAIKASGAVVHLAASGSVSDQDPVNDFGVNAYGTLLVLEELRASKDLARPLVYASTAEVYGGLKGVEMYVKGVRYEPSDAWISLRGINEEYPLDPLSPYVCSRSSAESYVLDYSRSFSMPSIVFRLSEVFGPYDRAASGRQTASMVLNSLATRPFSVKGDGFRVVDLLYVDDLVDAFVLALENAPRLSGGVFNIGGGPDNGLSELELIAVLSHRTGRTPRIEFCGSTQSPYYVSDTSRFRSATGWRPSIGFEEGIRRYCSHITRTKSATRQRRQPSNEICLNKP